jgi:hypothetical protein
VADSGLEQNDREREVDGGQPVRRSQSHEQETFALKKRVKKESKRAREKDEKEEYKGHNKT